MMGRGGANNQLATEKLEILWGARGNPRDWALRRGELADVQKIIAEVRKSLAGLQAGLADVKQNIDEINRLVDTLGDRIDAAERAIALLDSSLSELEGRINDADSKLTEIEQTIESLRAELGSIGGDTVQLQKDVDLLKQSVATNTDDITGLKQSISSLSQTVSTLSTDIAALKTNALSRYALQSNPGATPFPQNVYRAIPFYTNGELTGGITLTTDTVFTVPVAGLYQFELEVRTNGGLANMPVVGTPLILSFDSDTVPTSARAGYSTSDVVRATTITRLVCTERLDANAKRVAYLQNQGAAAYQVASAFIKITRISA